jgi:hypothetical protein
MQLLLAASLDIGQDCHNLAKLLIKTLVRVGSWATHEASDKGAAYMVGVGLPPVRGEE